MKIEYLGHSCFRLIGRNAEVVFDPFTGIGLPDPVAEADLVLCSHGHRDHSHVGSTAKPSAKVLVGFVGEAVHASVGIRGIAAYHDDEGGAKRGTNSIYVIVIDGLKVCHLGDLGHQVSDRDLREIRGVDVLLVPVGGFYTIGAKEASSLVDRIAPRIAIPMHYRTKLHSPGFANLSTVEDFASLRQNVILKGGSELSVGAGSLPESPTTVILE